MNEAVFKGFGPRSLTGANSNPTFAFGFGRNAARPPLTHWADLFGESYYYCSCSALW